MRPETWEQVYLYALGELRLTPKQFWRLSWPEYLALCAGHERRLVRAWQHTRLLTTVLLNIHRREGDPAQTVQQVMPLPGDAPGSAGGSVMSLEDLDATMARLNAPL